MTNTAHQVHRTDVDFARSWLLVAASNAEQVDAAAQSAADAVLLDLEDGVLPDDRDAARGFVQQRLSSGARSWVRINPAATDDWTADLDAVSALPGLQGVVLAKCESASQVTDTAAHLLADTPIVALVESALAIELAFSIASAENTSRLAFGSGDFRRDTGVGDDAQALAYARSRLVVASRAADLPPPIDGPTVPGGSVPLPEDLEVANRMGLGGKLCLHVEDVAGINRMFSPSRSDQLWANAIIEVLGENSERIRDGSDLPRLARARRIVYRASVFDS